MKDQEVKRNNNPDTDIYELIVNAMLGAAYTVVLLTSVKENAVDITEVVKEVYERYGITDEEQPYCCYRNANRFTKSVATEIVEAEIRFRTEFKKTLKFPENIQKEIYGQKYELSIDLVDYVSAMLPHFIPYGADFENGIENLAELLKDFAMIEEAEAMLDEAFINVQKEKVDN